MYCPRKKTCALKPHTDSCANARDEYYNSLSDTDRQLLIDDGWSRLALEIVKTAIEDKARGTTLGGGFLCTQSDIDNVSDFFKSELCYNLCGIDSTALERITNKLREVNNGKEEKTNK